MAILLLLTSSEKLERIKEKNQTLLNYQRSSNLLSLKKKRKEKLIFQKFLTKI